MSSRSMRSRGNVRLAATRALLNSRATPNRQAPADEKSTDGTALRAEGLIEVGDLFARSLLERAGEVAVHAQGNREVLRQACVAGRETCGIGSHPALRAPRLCPRVGGAMVRAGGTAVASPLSPVTQGALMGERADAGRQLGEASVERVPILLKVDEAADLLRTTPTAVYAMVARSQLPGVTRLGRGVLIRSADLLDWLD